LRQKEAEEDESMGVWEYGSMGVWEYGSEEGADYYMNLKINILPVK
jgi:hypothetical protein